MKNENLKAILFLVFVITISILMNSCGSRKAEKNRINEESKTEATTESDIAKKEESSSNVDQKTTVVEKEKVRELSLKGHIIETPSDLVKDPYVLEFLGLEESSSYTENELENRIINKLEHFLLELGTGFLFSGRQVRMSFDEKHFYVDLVFYNRLLKCFVLVDLKIGELKHQDIGQMQMYVNYYDRKIKSEEENKTIGIILCRDKSKAIVEMTLPEDNTQIFASKYQLILPSKEELKKIIEE